ncbi:hypothetical protein ACJMK2_036450 [Sinanodonta woodiana]|uniref:Coiled-coil domain-containing protein 170 n=1 Tax=Sinanodonta woodiana TaxID=1069815 RepID=A0ABD3WJD5_SINWO
MSYLRELERDGLPAIKTSASLLDSSRERRVAFEDDLRRRAGSPHSYIRSDAMFQPRPPSPSNNKRQLFELQEQVKAFQDELHKKEALIQQLVSMESIPKVQVRSTADSVRMDTMFLGDRSALEHARSELATVQVRNERLEVKVKELENLISEKDVKVKELNMMLETSKENECRLSNLVESLRGQISEIEGRAGAYQTVAGRSEYAVSALQKESKNAQEKIVDLESRLRKQLEERESAEARVQSFEKKYHNLVTNFSSVLRLEEITGALPQPEDIMRKLTDLVQENAMLKGRVVTLNEALNSTELETKASRETIMRLVSEVGKEQKVATHYTAELDALRMERDDAMASRRDFEIEVRLLKERLEATQRALEAARNEMELRDTRLSTLDREYRTTSHSIRSSQTQSSAFREDLASLLSEDDLMIHPTEESIKRRIHQIVSENRELRLKIESLEDRVRSVTEQLENQYELHKMAAERARKAENDAKAMDDRLRSAEGELAAGDVLRDGMRTDKEKYMKCLQHLGEVMKMDRISVDLGFDMTVDALLSRAKQLVKLEADALADRSTHIYNLQRKVKSLKEQLESKDLHIDMLRKKITSLEEKLLGKTTIEQERDNESLRIKKLEKLIEKYKLQLHDARQEITNLKAELLGGSELRIRTIEQRKEIEELVNQVNELESLRKKQARKIGDLKEEISHQGQNSEEKRVVADNAVQALSSELKTTKNALHVIQNREKQLVDFRIVVARMLGLDINTLAIPDYEIITRLEKLIQAHHSHTFTTMSLEEALADMEDGFLSGYEDFRRTAGSHEAKKIQRSRERIKRKAAQARARSVSPVRRDPRVY